jgi:exosortase/archaeosortase family protein
MGASFTRTFLLAAVMLLIPVCLIPEDYYTPLNQLTAMASAQILRLLAAEPVMVRGTHIALADFRVQVIAECSAVHLLALYGAFVFAFPAGRREKWIGWLAGSLLLLSLNAARIALVTLIGRHFPDRFEAVHIYLGQLGMLMATVVVCLGWCRWVSGAGRMEGPTGFVWRFLLFSGPLFLLWVPLNRWFMTGVDNSIEWIFALASIRLVIPQAHHLYYQTFSLVALGALLLAARGVALRRRLRWIGCGLGLCTLLQVAVRLCNVGISAFQIQWLAPIGQVVYQLCVHGLPMAVALMFLMRQRALGRPAKHLV